MLHKPAYFKSTSTSMPDALSRTSAANRLCMPWLYIFCCYAGTALQLLKAKIVRARLVLILLSLQAMPAVGSIVLQHWLPVKKAEGDSRELSSASALPLHGEVVVRALATGHIDGLVAFGGPRSDAGECRMPSFDVVLVAQILGGCCRNCQGVDRKLRHHSDVSDRDRACRRTPQKLHFCCCLQGCRLNSSS